WLANLGGGPNDFTAKIGGVTELQLVNAAAQPYTEYSYTYTATSTTTTLEFDAMQQPAQWDLDDVSVVPTGSVTPAPLPPPPGPPAAPVISSLVESPATGDLNAGKTVTFTLNFSEAVSIAAATPTLTLNDSGIATYSGGSGTNALTFSYAVAAGQNTSALAATALNLNSATISLTRLPPTAPPIHTIPPPAPIITFDKVMGKRVVLIGTEAQTGTTISVYDGTTLLGTTTTGTKGTWTYTTGPLAKGAHIFTATATDAAGNVSAASSPFDPQ